MCVLLWLFHPSFNSKTPEHSITCSLYPFVNRLEKLTQTVANKDILYSALQTQHCGFQYRSQKMQQVPNVMV